MLQGNEGGLPQRVDEYRAFMRFQSWEYDVLPWECDMGLSIYRYPGFYRYPGWWFGTMEFYDFPETVGEWKNHTN